MPQIKYLLIQKSRLHRMNIYACILNILVPHEVNNQSALLVKRTSQIMLNGQVIIQMRRVPSTTFDGDFEFINAINLCIEGHV